MDQFEEETELIKKVLTKLVKDSMLLELREQIDEDGNPISSVGDTSAGGSGSSAGDPVLMVHPQVDIDSIGATTGSA